MMTVTSIPKPALAAAAAIGAIALAYMAWSRPWYFTSQTYLGGLILLELLIVAIWRYRQIFFGLLIMAFLLAGMTIPGAAVGTSARWAFLAVGAFVGFFLLLKDRRYHFGVFHGIALFTVLASAVSAFASRYPTFALLKVLSLFLLFLYAASGARLSVIGREKRFLDGLLLGCELLIGAFGVCYLILGAQIMGNPNSLGAIAGVVGAPLLLWGGMVGSDVSARRRRFLVYALCMFLVFYSHSRAAILSALFSSALLCIGMRKYRALLATAGITLILLIAAAIVQPLRLFEAASTVISEVVYKGPLENGVFASRHSPWQDAIDSIRSHFWLGTGFGTTDKGDEASRRLGSFSSNSLVSTEYGSSYLEIVTWVGMLGVLPFCFLLILLTGKLVRTMSWLLRTQDASHPAIPLAMIVAAGMFHAAFEDWMFAPGYYLCVFYWCMAFVLVDIAPVRMAMATRPAHLQFLRLSGRAPEAIAQTP